MDPRLSGDPTIVVSTADPELLDHALSVVAAAGLEAEVTSDPGFLRARWSSASWCWSESTTDLRWSSSGCPGGRRCTC